MKKILLTLPLLLMALTNAAAQQVKELESKPKLVVGIIVDQMRWDYLTRFYERYTDGGFRRMMAEGYNCNRLSINYLPAVTAVGHACVYTGSVPALTGIVGNSFPMDGKWVTSVEDHTVKTVGAKGNIGECSPRRLLVSTITDELRLSTNFRSKTIGIALKDRAAILPAGHSANGAYWYDKNIGGFVTSTYYMDKLPKWAADFNKQGLAKKYSAIINEDRKDRDGYWDLLYDASTYVQSSPLKHERYFNEIGGDIRQSPYGCTITVDMALAAIEGEQLGRNPEGVTDMIAISFSSPDMIGHGVGPNAIWMEDVYLRLDQDIARLFRHLDENIGKDEWVAFLTADHAGSHNIQYRLDNGVRAQEWAYNIEIDSLNNHLSKVFETEERLVASYTNSDIYFDHAAIERVYNQRGSKHGGLTMFRNRVFSETMAYEESRPTIGYCFPVRNMPTYIPEPIRTMAVNGYNPKRSGDLQIVLEGSTTEDFEHGSSNDRKDGVAHGTNHVVWSPDDTHIPFIVMGKGVHHAWDNRTHYITDISATIAALLNIQQPNGCVGKAIF